MVQTFDIATAGFGNDGQVADEINFVDEGSAEAAPMVVRDEWAVVAPILVNTHSQAVDEQKQPSVDGSSGLDQYMPNAVGTDLINRASDEADVGETESASQEGRVRDES